MIDPVYKVFQELTRNDSFILYRGQQIFDKKSVLLKVPNRESSSSIGKNTLAREFEILDSLTTNNVSRLVQLNGDDCLVLEDKGGIPLRLLSGSNQL